ncbi:hypothetical protein E3N86_12520 [Cryobacterium sp. Hz7]|uniref:hypothetical protein n=1 Tax=Cryobacterium sp. Hz7 TaxID=1259166 RepID=UPI00106D8013|nr:hypothetical protein [Cryobacterium sp. Hz7]TFB59055.1 hypothetical protein E3N86_12520 [Cryobacterium sp. Hz7]
MREKDLCDHLDPDLRRQVSQEENQSNHAVRTDAPQHREQEHERGEKERKRTMHTRLCTGTGQKHVSPAPPNEFDGDFGKSG